MYNCICSYTPALRYIWIYALARGPRAHIIYIHQSAGEYKKFNLTKLCCDKSVHANKFKERK